MKKELKTGEKIKIKNDAKNYIKSARGKTGVLELLGNRFIIRLDEPLNNGMGGVISCLTVTGKDIDKL
jgi:hypothetical protein